MVKVATLGPNIRLVVFKFLIKSNLVSEVIPRLPTVHSLNTSTEENTGRQILASTPDVWVPRIVLGLFDKRSYKFVGARVAGERVSERVRRGKPIEVMMSDVRFTFCHRQYLNTKPPHENFATIKDQCYDTFIEMAINNLWSVEGYVNPHFQEDGTVGTGSVLMLDCNSRKEAILNGKPIKVYQGGREKSVFSERAGQGIGPKVSLIDKANRLDLSGNNIVLTTPVQPPALVAS